jgi:hypothetical protein
VSGTASISSLFGRLTPRAGLRWTGSSPEVGLDEERWSATAAASATVRRTTLAIEYERIEAGTEGATDPDYVEHLATATLGRAF